MDKPCWYTDYINSDTGDSGRKVGDHMEDIKTKVREALEAGVIIGDGHTLFRPEFYAPYFSEDELKKARLIQTHKSDGTPKGTIFASDGSVVPELKGVYNLSFLYWVAGRVGVTKYVRAEGRGSQASELVGYIREAVAV